MGHTEFIQSKISISKRIPELDGIRGLAILLVISYHYIAVAIPKDASPVFQFLRQMFSNGWSGVDLFFVLSGFLITRILIDKRGSKNFFKTFYIRRINRIFPLYYFFLLVFLFLQRYGSQWGLFSTALFSNSIPIAPYIFFLQNFTMAAQGTFGNEFLAMTWSLAIEEQFYLFLPLLVRFSKPKRLPLNILFFISLPLILRATLGDGGYYGFVLTPWRLDSLFLGSLLAVIVRTPTLIIFLKTNLKWIKIAFSFMFLLILYSTFTEELGSLDHLFLFGLFYTTLILLTLTDKTFFISRIFRNSTLIYIGTISFGLYMFHQLTNGILHDLIFKSLPSFSNISTILVTFLGFLLTLFLATGTYHAFEKRFVAFSHKSSYSDE